MLKRTIISFGKNIDHKKVLELIKQDVSISWQIVFFVIISAGIAILGLLSNSPAAIIGAMLISPLMGPIVSQGFALATMDIALLKKSSLCILVSSFLGIFTAFLIVILSPITEVTPEIIARTNPNLFDLLIAILSAMAAGYSFINQREHTIIGVAIATSLMPPLAVTGFGLATGNIHIAEGSFFLFMTNFVAICITIFSISKLYRFRGQKYNRTQSLQLILALFILIIIAIPLSVSLKDIAYQSYIVKISKKTIESCFENETSNLNSFSVAFDNSEVKINAVIGIRYYKPNAEQIILENLQKVIKKRIKLRIFQVGLANEKAVENKLKPHVIAHSR